MLWRISEVHVFFLFTTYYSSQLLELTLKSSQTQTITENFWKNYFESTLTQAASCRYQRTANPSGSIRSAWRQHQRGYIREKPRAECSWRVIIAPPISLSSTDLHKRQKNVAVQPKTQGTKFSWKKNLQCIQPAIAAQGKHLSCILASFLDLSCSKGHQRKESQQTGHIFPWTKVNRSKPPVLLLLTWSCGCAGHQLKAMLQWAFQQTTKYLFLSPVLTNSTALTWYCKEGKASKSPYFHQVWS